MSGTPCVICLAVGEHHVDCPRTLRTVEDRCGSCGAGLMQKHDETCDSWAMLGKMWALREQYVYEKVMLAKDYQIHMCASCESAVVGLPKEDISHLSECRDRGNVVTAGSMESALNAVREARNPKPVIHPASTRQVGGEHYQKKIQPWDVVEAYELDYFEGNVLKYLLRRKVNRLEDLRKAAHYLEKVIEREEGGRE